MKENDIEKEKIIEENRQLKKELKTYIQIEEDDNKRMISYLKKIETLEKQNEFLRKRENKLQMIEQMFKNKQINLKDLCTLVEGE